MFGESLENENEQEKQMMLQRSQSMGQKMRTIFVSSLIIIIATGAMTLVALSSYLTYSYNTSKLLLELVVCAVAILVGTILYCVSLFSLGGYYDAFKTAGILMLVCTGLTLVKNLVPEGLASLVALVSAILKIFQMKYFVEGSETSLRGVDAKLSEKWDLYWRAYMITLIATIVCELGIYAPGLSSIAGVGEAICSIAALIIGIWMLVLINQTSQAHLKFVDGSEKDKSGEHAETPEETALKASRNDIKKRINVISWIILVFVIALGAIIYVCMRTQQYYYGYFDQGIQVISWGCRYVLWGGSVVYAVMTWLLKKHHKAFWISGICAIVASLVEFVGIYQGYILVPILHRTLGVMPTVLNMVAWALQIVFLTIAIGSCVKNIDASLERKWVVFKWAYPIAMGVALVLYLICNSKYAYQTRILGWLSYYSYFLRYAVNMVLLIILFVFIKKTGNKLNT